MKLLVVDDDPDLAETLAILLTKLRHEVVTATSGRDAVALARARAFDLVILDVRMPDMDGFAVLRALKEQGSTASIVMLTGQGDVEDAVEAAKLGADDYLPKPIRVAGLERVLATIATTRGIPTNPGGPA